MSIEGQGHFLTIYFPGFVCTRPRYQVSVYRTIGPLVYYTYKRDCDIHETFVPHLSLLLQICSKLPDLIKSVKFISAVTIKILMLICVTRLEKVSNAILHTQTNGYE